MGLKRFCLRVFFAVMTTAGLVGQDRPLRMVSDVDFPPITYLDGNKPSGLWVDVAQAVGEHLGRPFTMKLEDWALAQREVAEGSADVLLSLNFTDARKKLFDFSVAVTRNRYSLFRSNQRPDLVDLDYLDDLNGLRVGVTEGGLPRSLVEPLPLINLRIYKTYEEAFTDLRAGTLDVFAGDLWVGSYILNHEKIDDVAPSSQSFATFAAGFAVKKGNSVLLEEINRAIKGIKEDGTLGKIIRKWEPFQVVIQTREQIQNNFWKVAVAFGGSGILVLVGWIGFLRREIQRRKRAEKSLGESVARLRTLIDTIPDLVWLKDPQGAYLNCNLRFEQLFGATEGEMAGKTDFDFVDLESANFFRNHDRKAIEAGRPTTNEEEITFATDGHKETIETIKTPVFGTDGNLLGVLGIGRDITGRKSQELELQRMNRFYNLLSQLGKVLFLAENREQLFEEFCRTAASLGEFPLVSCTWLDPATGLVRPAAKAGGATGYLVETEFRSDTQPEGMGPIGICIRENRTVVCQNIAEAPNMAPWQAKAEVFGLRSAASIPLRLGGEVVGTFTVYAGTVNAFRSEEVGLLEQAALEISAGLERFAAESAFRDNQRRYRMVFEHSGTVNALYDANYCLVLQNSLFQKEMKSEGDQNLGKPVEYFFGDVTGKVIRNRMERIQKTKRAETFETFVSIASGKKWFQSTYIPYFDDDDNFMGVQVTSMDVTESHLLAERVQNTERLESLGILGGGIAHDFNNLLGSLQGYLELAELNLKENKIEAALVRLDKTKKVFDHAKSLTRQLLTFAKGGLPLRKPENLGPLVREWVVFVLSGSDIVPEITVDQGLWVCECDRNQIEQVVDNLVINARQASPPGGTVRVQVANRPGDTPGICIVVSDQGAGIPEEIRSKIFDPFFTTKPHGTGLGLSTAHSIARHHGGWLEPSFGPGPGTTMTLFLPAVSREEKKVEETVPSEPLHQNSGRALVMDDQPAIRESVGEMLGLMGYEVTLVCDGDEALEVAETEGSGPLVLVVLDLTIPGGLGGLETALRMRKAGTQAKIVMMSGYSTDYTDAKTEGLFDAKLVKPFTMQDLSLVLGQLAF